MPIQIHEERLTTTRVQFDYQPEAPDLWFDAYTDGSRWNGWACPLFTREQADKVVTFLNTGADEQKAAERGPRARYDAERDAYIVHFDDGFDDGPDVYAGINVTTPDGQSLRLYPIGAWGCTWVDEADE